MVCVYVFTAIHENSWDEHPMASNVIRNLSEFNYFHLCMYFVSTRMSNKLTTSYSYRQHVSFPPTFHSSFSWLLPLIDIRISGRFLFQALAIETSEEIMLLPLTKLPQNRLSSLCLRPENAETTRRKDALYVVYNNIFLLNGLL